MTEWISGIWENLLGDVAFAVLASVASYLFFRWRSGISALRGNKSLSPDSKQVLFESGKHLFVADKDGLRQLTRRGQDRYPQWSPDSRLIAYSSLVKENWDVWIVEAKTGKTVQLTTAKGPERPIGWNERGDLLVNMGGATLIVNRNEIEKRLRDG